ncbi:MAG: hypothetical protein H0W49_11310 [Nitrospirales bacterium]|nr:hypothetical protein [Nitrospirales bacterium]
MNEKSNMADSTESHAFGNMSPASPSYLLEAELDREWERRHRQGDAEHSSVSSTEEEFGT